MKSTRGYVAGAFLLATLCAFSAGCSSSSDSTTKQEEEAFKQRDPSKVKLPPADAMKPPSGFSSSINDGPGPKGTAPGTTGK